MSSRAAFIASRMRAILLLSLVVIVFMMVRNSAIGSMVATIPQAAVQRIMAIAFSDSAEMRWLLVTCAAAGLLVLLDRRRRARVRQACA